jgi:guanylate kinase
MNANGSPLKLINSFVEELADYHPNPDKLNWLTETPFALLAAPTAAGRNTLIQKLVSMGAYYYVVSDTTRKPRINNGIEEKNGETYWFKTEADFLNDLRSGYYLEAAVIHDQQVSGISLREIEKAHNAHKVAITDIDVQGCRTLLKLSNNIIPIFILPPTFDKWMMRLDARGTMSAEEKKRRLTSAASEIDYALLSKKFIFVINDDLDEAADKLDRIVNNRQDDETNQQFARAHARQLLQELLKNK